MKGRAIVSLALALAVALAATACSSPSGTTTGGTATQTVPTAGMFGIIRDWSESTHSVPVTFAAEETGCAGCHDGRAYSLDTSSPASLNASAPFGPYVTPTGCPACHTGRGEKVLQSGKVSTPTSSTVSAGLGALCIDCHRERSKPSPGGSPHGPHPSVQGALYLGYGGFRSAGVTYTSTVQHVGIKNMCVGCHMKDNAEKVPTHTFLPTSPQAVCGPCHQGATTYDRKVSADYDGNGKVEGIQTEVSGLLSELESATVKQMGATKLADVEGSLVFYSGTTTMTAPIPKKVYEAAYNWALVTNDKSMGVHNPAYTVELLQQSYLALTGKPVPNAKPFPGTSFGASGTATGTTPGTP